MMRGYLFQQPIRSLFVQTIERVRALDAVIVGA
jgi:hypothetical protein